MQSQLFVCQYKLSEESAAGLLRINKDTLAEFETFIQQSRVLSISHINFLANKIEKEGYDQTKPIALYLSTNKTTDGSTRSMAIKKLIDSNRVEEVLVTFVRGNADPASFNDTRGLVRKDLEQYFKISGSISGGSSDRAIEQAIEASKMLDAETLPFTEAFDSLRAQTHLVKIDSFLDRFTEAYVASMLLCDSLGIKPDECKFSHWLALFVRHGVTTTSKNLAKNKVIGPRGTDQRERLAVFQDLEKQLQDTRYL